MEKSTNLHIFHHKKALLVAIVAFLFAAVCTYITYLEGPHDLGSKLEYIGTSYSSGCVLFYCDSPASTEYYFGTDMSVEELKGYFSNAKFSDINQEDGARDYAAFNLGFDPIHPNVSQGFNIRYYLYPESVLSVHHFNTQKAHIVSLSDWSYQQARANFR